MVRGVHSPGATKREHVRAGIKIQGQLVLQKAYISTRSVLACRARTERLAVGGNT